MFNNQLPGGRGKGWEEKPQVAGFAIQKILPPLPICSYLCDFTECHGAGNRCTQSALMSRHKLLKPAIYQLKLQLKSFIYKTSCILLGGGQISKLLNQKQWVINGTIRVSQTHSYLQSRQSCQWAWKSMSSQVLCPQWWWHCQGKHLLQVQASPPALSVPVF